MNHFEQAIAVSVGLNTPIELLRERYEAAKEAHDALAADHA